ncbi:MAG: hypothetical protein HUU21_35035 [Polyangiaceae bacterium]|nr:hypothetical protein [Polyangiaceae bacterium]
MDRAAIIKTFSGESFASMAPKRAERQDRVRAQSSMRMQSQRHGDESEAILVGFCSFRLALLAALAWRARALRAAGGVTGHKAKAPSDGFLRARRL